MTSAPQDFKGANEEATNWPIEKLRTIISGIQGPELALRHDELANGSRTPDIHVSSPSVGSDINAAHPAATHMSEDHAKSDASLARRPSPLRTAAGVAALLDNGGDPEGETHSASTEHEHEHRATTPSVAPLPQPNSGVPPGGRTSARGGPSTFRGVVWHKSNCKWEARIYEGGKQKFLGYFTNENAAAMAYDDYAARIHGNAAKLNFPERYAGVELPPPTHPPPPARQSSTGSRAAASRARAVAAAAAAAEVGDLTTTARRGSQRVQPVKGSSRFRGVSWNSNCSKWRAQVWKGSEVHHLGYFEREEDAAHAYDEAVLGIRGPDAPTNYPKSHYGVSEDDDAASAGPLPLDRAASGAVIGSPAAAAAAAAAGSRMLGVSWDEINHVYNAEIWDGKRYNFLGAYSSEVEAAKAYDIACLAQHGLDALTNFPLTEYEEEAAAAALKALSEDPTGFELQHSDSEGQRAVTPPLSYFAATPGATSEEEGDLSAAQRAATPLSAFQATKPAHQTPPPPSGVVSHRGTSRYLGVSWDRRKGRWFSQIQIRGQRKFLGYYNDELAAAKAYDASAMKLHGASAALNFPVAGAAKSGSHTITTGADVVPMEEDFKQHKPAPKIVIHEKPAKSKPLPAKPPTLVRAPNAPAGATDENLRRLAGHLYELLQQQQQQLVTPAMAPFAAASAVPTPQQALASIVQAMMVRQQQEAAAAAAVAAWEGQFALQQRLARAAAAAGEWARSRINAAAASLPGTKRSYEEMAAPNTATTAPACATSAAYHNAFSEWAPKRPCPSPPPPAQ